MKILNVNAVLDPVTGGGTAERTVKISRALGDEGVDCTIMTTDLGLSNGTLPGLDDLHIIAYRCILKRFYVPLVRYADIVKIVKDVDVVHIMGHWTILNALVYMAARSLDKPYVVCPAGALPVFGRSRVIKKIYNWLVGRNIIKNATACIAITRDEQSQFTPYGVEAGSITVIPNGVSAADFPDDDGMVIKAECGIDEDPFILFMGRLNVIKGPDILLEAFSRGRHDWPDWHLVYAGPDGGLLEPLQKKVAEAGLTDHVHFIGYVGGARKSAAYHAADLLAIPSRQEAMSIVALEAGICGTAVIMTDACGFPEMSQAGAAVEVDTSVEGIQNALASCISRPDVIENMGMLGKAFIGNNYTWGTVAKQYLDVYENLAVRR